MSAADNQTVAQSTSASSADRRRYSAVNLDMDLYLQAEVGNFK